MKTIAITLHLSAEAKAQFESLRQRLAGIPAALQTADGEPVTGEHFKRAMQGVPGWARGLFVDAQVERQAAAELEICPGCGGIGMLTIDASDERLCLDCDGTGRDPLR